MRGRGSGNTPSTVKFFFRRGEDPRMEVIKIAIPPPTNEGKKGGKRGREKQRRGGESGGLMCLVPIHTHIKRRSDLIATSADLIATNPQLTLPPLQDTRKKPKKIKKQTKRGQGRHHSYGSSDGTRTDKKLPR